VLLCNPLQEKNQVKQPYYQYNLDYCLTFNFCHVLVPIENYFILVSDDILFQFLLKYNFFFYIDPFSIRKFSSWSDIYCQSKRHAMSSLRGARIKIKI